MSEKRDKVKSEPYLEEKLAALETKFVKLEEKYAQLRDNDKSGDEDVSRSTPPEKEVETKDEGAPTTNGTSSDANVDAVSTSRVRVVTNKYDPVYQERKDFEPTQLPADTLVQKKTEQALLLRRYIYSDEEGDGDIIIYDHGLRNFLRKLLAHYPFHWTGDTITIPSPYELIILNWNLLWDESGKVDDTDNDIDKQARADLRELLELLQKGSGDPRLDNYLQNRESYRKERCITFEALWTIFPPGAIILGRLFLKRDQLLIVQDNYRTWPVMDSSRRSGNPPPRWKLSCWTYDYDGEVFSRRSVTVDFEEFENTKPISSLPFHPLQEHEKRQEIEAGLFERGQAFRKYCTANLSDRLYGYDGDAILDSVGFRGMVTDETRDYDRRNDIYFPQRALNLTYPVKKGNVMVDFQSYYQYGLATSRIGDTIVYDEQYDCQCEDCLDSQALQACYRQSYDGMKGVEDEKWEKLQTMLCPPRVLGYVLKDKQWAQLAVDKLVPLPNEDETTVMDKLHLSGGANEDGEETKSLLCGLVKNHGVEDEKGTKLGRGITDIVPEKGKGLVFLLYGNPGVGKTSTGITLFPQIIAQAVRKPLFSVSVGDVGTTAKDVERNLQTIFELASVWKAILLIVLEYYRGILFLTTNQIAQFDVAVQSRIHIALKYNKLTKSQTTKIFRDFIDQYRRQGGIKTEDKDIVKYGNTELFKKGFDGRQIRNIVTTAVGYARGIGVEKMNLEHIRHVVGFVDDFKTDLSAQLREWEFSQGKTSYDKN
ncbi:MAG: hypothetical protein M1820_007682 [Bogoriella megaspora]|nr:MAG: hypothetical protein M1820_007682 [Bogoriella megaspora]